MIPDNSILRVLVVDDPRRISLFDGDNFIVLHHGQIPRVPNRHFELGDKKRGEPSKINQELFFWPASSEGFSSLSVSGKVLAKNSEAYTAHFKNP